MPYENKPIIATTLSGLFIKQEPWNKAHIGWYEKAAERLRDPSIKQWINRSDYFKGVDEVMKKISPQLSDVERTKKAREMFFDSVCEYIRKNPQVVNRNIVDYFKSLKSKYRLALITTNTQVALDRILKLSNLTDLFDITEASKPHEKDDKGLVFERFIKKWGKPTVYIGGNRKESFDYCKENNIPCIFANFEKEEYILDIKSAHNLEELKKLIS